MAMGDQSHRVIGDGAATVGPSLIGSPANQDQTKDQRTQIPPDQARRPRTLEPL
jgi:hypothetical protein